MLLKLAEDEIWVMQRTTGHNTNISLSRVVTVVLAVCVGKTFPVMRLIIQEHPVPLGLSAKSTAGVANGKPSKQCYDRGPLFRCVSDAAVFGTIRDYPDGLISFKLIRQDLIFSERHGQEGVVPLFTNDQTGRVGNALHKAHQLFQNAFVPEPKQRTRRRKKKSAVP